MTEVRAIYSVSDTPPDVAEEIERLVNKRLIPELLALLSGEQSFRIEIHGKPGSKCRVSVTRYDP